MKAKAAELQAYQTYLEAEKVPPGVSWVMWLFGRCVWCSSDGAICCSDLFNLKSNGDVFIIQGCYKL